MLNGMRHIGILVAILLLGCTPADECEGPLAGCDRNVAITCQSRAINDLQSYWDFRSMPCGDRFCRAANGAAYCALDPAEDPACPEELRGSYQASGCVAGVLTTWRYGARIAAETCANGTTCLALDGACSGEVFCVASTSPEPLCAGAFTRCVDEQVIAYCRCGIQVDAHACENPGPRCVIEDSAAVCRR